MRCSLIAFCILAMLFLSACSFLPPGGGFEQILTTQVPQQAASADINPESRIYENSPAPTPAPAYRAEDTAAAPAQEIAEAPQAAAAPVPAQTEQPASENEAQAFTRVIIETPAEQIRRVLLEGGLLSSEDSGYNIQITFETDDLYSCVVFIEAGEESEQVLKPFTIDKQEGQLCRLSDFFSNANTGWKSVIPDLVTKDAMERGMTLLCDVPPVSGDQPFYIQDGSIVLLYRPYEIATYEAGWPRFVLPMQELGEYTTGAYGIGGNE